ncbi:hypothetical protein C8Q74DRAFT_1220761 [Fomes fomentarius]|nr:hypothetical protein C8Q74DRAFT_1220761 [Fomes fomentarius]
MYRTPRDNHSLALSGYRPYNARTLSMPQITAAFLGNDQPIVTTATAHSPGNHIFLTGCQWFCTTGRMTMHGKLYHSRSQLHDSDADQSPYVLLQMLGVFDPKEHTVDEMKLSAGWKVTEIRRELGSLWAYIIAALLV